MQTAAGIEAFVSAGRYKAVLCDLWGVVHNGVSVHQGAIESLRAMRAQGITVILLSNAPRASVTVREQLAGLGLPPGCYDDVVTSGDMVFRWLCEQSPRPRCYHLGQSWGLSLFGQGEISLTDDIDAADLIVCSALPFEEERISHPFYDELFTKAIAQKLPLLCANPDLTVHKGESEVYCAGALAGKYHSLGGQVRYLGKPYPEVYQFCQDRIADLRKEKVEASDILVIGDGLRTDIRGGNQAGIDSVLITSGLHRDQLGVTDHPSVLPDPKRLELAFNEMGARPNLVLSYLSW